MPATMDVVKIWYNHNGSQPEQRRYPVAGGEVFKRGELLYFVAGQLKVATAVGTNVGAGILPVGIALENAVLPGNTTGLANAGDLISVALATELLRWVLPISNAGATQNAADADMGNGYNARRQAIGQWCIDRSDASRTILIPINQHIQYGVFNVNAGVVSGVGSVEPFGWYICRFDQDQVAWDV